MQIKDKRHHVQPESNRVIIDLPTKRKDVLFDNDTIELSPLEEKLNEQVAGLKTKEVTFADEAFQTTLTAEQLRNIAASVETNLKSIIALEWQIETALKVTPEVDTTARKSFSDYAMRLEHNIQMLRDLANYKAQLKIVQDKEKHDREAYGITVHDMVYHVDGGHAIGQIIGITSSEEGEEPEFKVIWQDDPKFVYSCKRENLIKVGDK